MTYGSMMPPPAPDPEPIDITVPQERVDELRALLMREGFDEPTASTKARLARETHLSVDPRNGELRVRAGAGTMLGSVGLEHLAKDLARAARLDALGPNPMHLLREELTRRGLTEAELDEHLQGRPIWVEESGTIVGAIARTLSAGDPFAGGSTVGEVRGEDAIRQVANQIERRALEARRAAELAPLKEQKRAEMHRGRGPSL